MAASLSSRFYLPHPVFSFRDDYQPMASVKHVFCWRWKMPGATAMIKVLSDDKRRSLDCQFGVKGADFGRCLHSRTTFRMASGGNYGPVSLRIQDLRFTKRQLASKGQLSRGTWDGTYATSDNSEPFEDDTSQKPQSGFSKGRWARFQKVITKLLFRLPHEQQIWTVPWDGQTIFQVMFLWFTAFWFVGSWFIPIVAHIIGFNKDSLSYRGQALYSLITDIAGGTIGIGILRQCLSRFQPLPRGWFPIKWQGKWYLEACLGCLVFPFVSHLSQINLDLLPFPAPFMPANVEQSIMAKDPVATIIYGAVVAVCAPIWEEVIFRGFLLPSLTRYLPLWASIFLSSLAFALAHFSLQRLLPLTFLGLVMGIIFVRNRNLLASILLHSLWNGFVFLDLLRYGIH